MEAGVSSVDPRAPWLLNEEDSHGRRLLQEADCGLHCLPTLLQRRPPWCVLVAWRAAKGAEEAVAAGNRESSAWYNKLWWPHLSWCRECCVALEEIKFERVPDDMSVELDHITKGPLTTLDIENTFNMDRDQMRHTKGGQIWEARNLAQDDPCCLAS